MRKTTVTILLTGAAVILCPSALGAGKPAYVKQPRTAQQKAEGIPVIELEPKLSRIFKVRRCEFISGMTCHITYNGKMPLPSEVFFVEYDAQGKRLGKKTRLIYPKLKKGETGYATFFLRSAEPARIIITAVWNGPWRNPY